MEDSSDRALLEEAKRGSEAAFSELMRRHTVAIQNVAVGILRDAAEAEDEAQNAWWMAWRHIADFEGTSKFSTWVTRIVMNQCFMRLRRARRPQLLHLDDQCSGGQWVSSVPDSGETPEQSAANRETYEILARELGCLPPLLRHPLLLRDLDELPLPEVASRLGISVPAAKSRLLRGRAELRSRLERLGLRHNSATIIAPI